MAAFSNLLRAGADIITIRHDTAARKVILPNPYRVHLTSQRSAAKVWDQMRALRQEPPFSFHVATYGADSSGDYLVSMTAETFVALLGAHYKNEVQPRERQGEHAS